MRNFELTIFVKVKVVIIDIFDLQQLTVYQMMEDKHLLTTPIPLTQQEQKIFRTHGSNLDTVKYKKGKESYMAFKQSITNQNNYRAFVQKLRALDYLNKMLLISSIKYYRDIKTLLMGKDAEDEKINSHIGGTALSVEQAVMKMDEIIEGKKQVNFSQYHVVSSQKKGNAENVMRTEKKEQQKDQIKEQKTDQKVNRFARVTRSLKTETGQQKQLKVVEKQLKKETNVLQSSINKKQTVTQLKETQQQKFQKIDSSQYKYLKLIEVQSKSTKNKSEAPKSDRTNTKLSVNSQKEQERAPSVRSFGKSTKLITDLTQNQLYHKHRSSPEKGEKQNKNYFVPSSKNLSSQVKRSTSTKSSHSRRRNQENICDKLMSCLKWLFSPRQVEPVQKTNKNAEEKEGLIKKKGSSIATKSGVIKKYP